ncbi:cobaltochelatase subunit CobN, partial [Ameyamaea chiangmaiensis]
MHLLVRERQGVEAQEVAEDLGHAPADIVFLSFSDSDLLAVERGWDRLEPGDATLRAVTLGRLRHPMSIDLYVEQTIAGARCVVVRLLGGLEYWRYGAEEVLACCERHGLALAFLAGDGRDDARLAEWSRIGAAYHARLEGFFREGGDANIDAALSLMLHLAGRGADDGRLPQALPPCGPYRALGDIDGGDAGFRACVVFYRASLLAADMAAIDALGDALAAAGATVDMVYVASPKAEACARWLSARLEAFRPDIVLNATFFATRGEGICASPLDVAGCPVLQVLLPTSTRPAWADSARGLSQSDLAMQVVLPELDGRLNAGAISFKTETAPGHPARHEPDPDGIARVVARARSWARLGQLAPSARRVGIVLSDYPGAGDDGTSGQAAHAVGLDGFASVASIVGLLAGAGYATGDAAGRSVRDWADGLGGTATSATVSLAAYRTMFDALPIAFRQAVETAWGGPEDDPALREGFFHHRAVKTGGLVVAVQPDRGQAQDRKASYHDADLPPRHAYVAFYLWLRSACALDAMVHLGAHGTLEWLPGKAVALSDACAPEVLCGNVPVIYPFIINNPGEAAAAKRRLGAVMIGHMTPPVRQAGLHGDLADLERLIDEYAAADGLDRRRGALLRADILTRAADLGVLDESGPPSGTDEDECLARLDAYLCDVKDLQIRDGLHVFGRPAPFAGELVHGIAAQFGLPPDDVERAIARSGEAEAHALLDALDGHFIEPGPAGAPTRGRADVLPTGRNLYTIDPRAVPTRAACELARAQAALLLQRHLQEQGEPLRRIVIDLWGSASLRTGGEDLALALLLMGVEPEWDRASGRVTGIAIMPLAVLDRPRVDVTLRISGLFRDAFPAQIGLFDQAVRAVAAREEDAAWNTLAASVRGMDEGDRDAALTRIFGAAPGTYGAGVESALMRGDWDARGDLAARYLDASGWAYGGGREGTAVRDAFAARLADSDAILHVQDHAEIDILESPDIAAHWGGLAAAAESLGAAPALWHGDTSRVGAPRLRA